MVMVCGGHGIGSLKRRSLRLGLPEEVAPQEEEQQQQLLLLLLLLLLLQRVE